MGVNSKCEHYFKHFRTKHLSAHSRIEGEPRPRHPSTTTFFLHPVYIIWGLVKKIGLFSVARPLPYEPGVLNPVTGFGGAWVIQPPALA